MTLRPPIRRSLWIATAFLLATVLLKELARRHALEAETVDRLIGMGMGVVVMLYANVIPKTLVPLARLSGDPARDQAARRLAGWVMVSGGLGYLLAFALAPIALAGPLGMAVLALSVLGLAGVVARCAWAPRGGR